MYSFFKKILFLFNPEIAHDLTLKSLRFMDQLKLTVLFPQTKSVPINVMGLHFLNPIGLAAGFDKNGDCIDGLASLGFGFIEVGTVTPKPQKGNTRPRLFRLTEQEAIINRMGFNNKGVDYLVERLKKTKYKGILGVNLGKNKDTPIERALDDYLYGLNRVLPFASYVVINISSPNTQNLRQLQEASLLQGLLHSLKNAQALFLKNHAKYVPLVVKIAPDLSSEQINDIATIFLNEKIDGVIATNTTIHREGVEDSPFVNELGGLSGKPLFNRSTEIVKQLNRVLQNKIPIIACGGVMSAADAKEKIAAGAALLQVYTGLVYRGPGLIRELIAYSTVTDFAKLRG